MRRLVGVGVLLLLVAGCGLWGPEGGPGGVGRSAPASPGAAPAVAAVVGADGVQRIRIEMTDGLKFVPDRVLARPGVIEFTLHDQGVTPHSVTVEVPGEPESGNLNGGDTRTLRVTATRPGDYPFPCLYHAASGMRGVLTVTGAPLTGPTAGVSGTPASTRGQRVGPTS